MLINSLDYERTQSYVLLLLAYDEDPVKVLSSTSTLTITVQDYNDNAPNCSSYNIIRDVEEVTALNTVLETIVCSDVDTINKSGVVNYKIIAGTLH
ncbi:protocadherin Fat 3-like [Physella acuta]|uniref:protocadherin Fat 3-like n=1 Tax=Physella acuta TaxID=109671 RepID=UPI0027DCAC04|nr:protocadherin Fat 3-like [Physella acuta]